MPLKFKACELPNPFLLTSDENMEFMKKKEAEAEAAGKKTGKGKAPEKATTTRSRKRKADENVDPSSTAAAAAAPAGSSKLAKKAKKAKAPAVDLYSVYLEREEEGEVEVYDSCDELRRKITAHLRAGGTTKAAFMRDIIRAASSDEYPIKAIQHKQLADFMALSGATGGCSSKVCYAAYVYFEKKRIAEGGEKSEHRLDMEDEWEGEGGLPRERRRESYLIPTGTVLCEDEVGRLVTVPDCCS